MSSVQPYPPSCPAAGRWLGVLVASSLLLASSGLASTQTGTTNASPSPGLHVAVATSGTDLDAGGYRVDVSRSFECGWWCWGLISVANRNLPANAEVTLSGLEAGDYQVTLSGFATNCDVISPNPRRVTLDTWGASVSVAFTVTCGPVGQLAFDSTADGNAEIYVINPDGTGTRRLTMDPASDVAPAWSPDGSRLAFQSDRDGDAEIYLMNADGSNPLRLTDAVGEDGRPAWSPDGTRIAFTSSRDGNGEIYVMEANGAGVLNLTNDPADDGDPSWSPDGTRIAFRSSRDGDPGSSRIYVMNADGSGVTRLSSDPWDADAEPAWSPDGTLLAFSRVACDWWSGCMRSIWIMSSDGSGAGQLTGSEYENHNHPVWSPDGRSVAFAGIEGVSLQINRLSEPYNAAGLAGGRNPAWRR